MQHHEGHRNKKWKVPPYFVVLVLIISFQVFSVVNNDEGLQLSQNEYFTNKHTKLENDNSIIQGNLNGKGDDGEIILNPLKSFNDTFCLAWNVNSDEWWTHHADWRVSREDDDEYCFSPMAQGGLKQRTFQNLYNIQFRGDCSKGLTKPMWSSGFGADIANVVDGVKKALETKQPFQIWNKTPWHYAAKKDGSRPVCPEKSMHCYFLPLSSCDPNLKNVFNNSFYYKFQPMYRVLTNRLYMEYATRQRTWLRKAVYDFSKNINLTRPCTVMHVRRGDVVLHEAWTRRYHPLGEYIDATDQITNTVLLLTDDDNAIKEALSEFPGFNWVYIDRLRFKGKEGGWENHIPSDDPRLEVIVLGSIFRMAGFCKVLIHTRSNLADYIAAMMMNARGRDFLRVNLDTDSSKIYKPEHAESHNISKAVWR